MQRRNTQLLRDVLKQVLQENHLDTKLAEKHLIEAWPKVLGKSVEQYTRSREIKNSILYVSISSAVLRHDLFISREEIKNALNAHVGSEVIKDIVFR
jgi:predicted nucleic acid-binding Zn ribbon protein